MEGFIVDGIINKNVLLFINSQEMSSMTVFYQLAVRNLYVLEHLYFIVHDSKDFKP
jgi:hypothetical protein